MELIAAIFDKTKSPIYDSMILCDMLDFNPEDWDHHLTYRITYSDLASNLCFLNTLDLMNKKKSGLSQVPIVASSEDFDVSQLIEQGSSKLLIIKKGEPMPGLTLKVKLVVASLEGQFSGLNHQEFQNSPIAENDYWLYFSEANSKDISLFKKLFSDRDSTDGFVEMKEPSRFFYLDACAVFGGLPSIEDPNPKMQKYLMLALFDQSILQKYEESYKTLKLVYRAMGGVIQKGFLAREWSRWASFYSAKIHPQYPISDGVAKFLKTKQSKGKGFRRSYKA